MLLIRERSLSLPTFSLIRTENRIVDIAHNDKMKFVVMSFDEGIWDLPSTQPRETH